MDNLEHRRKRGPAKQDYEVTSIRVPRADLARARRYADSMDVPSISWVIRRALSEFLDRVGAE